MFGAGVAPNRLGVDAAADAPNRLGAAAGVPNSDGVDAAGAAEAPNKLGVDAGVPNSDGAGAPGVLAAPQDAPGALGVANAMPLLMQEWQLSRQAAESTLVSACAATLSSAQRHDRSVLSGIGGLDADQQIDEG
jgi:hypothetical protein